MKFWKTTDADVKSPPPVDNSRPSIDSNEARLRRIESRLVQIMFHMGMNPYQKEYDDNGNRLPKKDWRPK